MPAKLTQMVYGGFNAHELGEISVTGQSGKFLPDKLGQKEIRQLHLKIETFQQDYASNYNLMQQARAAFSGQNKVLKWTTAQTELSDGSTIEGTVVLNRPVTVVSHDLPEDPNSWGTYNQAINIVVEYEQSIDNAAALGLTFKRTDFIGAAVGMGLIYEFKRNYRFVRYNELRSNLQRVSGSVTARGEIFVNLPEATGSTDNRRSILEAHIESLIDQIKGRDGTMVFGDPDSPTFNHVVRTVSFDADINQEVSGITWEGTFEYTEFPNETGYAAADFVYRASEDRQTGEMTLALSGKVGAATQVLAVAKLESLKAAVLKAAGYPAGLLPIRNEVSPRFVNGDDTQTQSDGSATDITADMGATASPNLFIELSFDLQWRKRSSSLVSYQLKITDSDGLNSGLIHRTYSGTVVAGGATADQAYQTAVAQANTLGDKKHPFRMEAKITRSDRKIESTGTEEFLEVEFSFDYQVKGSRIYIELTTETISEKFGEDTIHVNGFIVAADYSSAKTAYNSQVRALYAANLIKTESTSNISNIIQMGPNWTPTGSVSEFTSMAVKFNFNLTIWIPKINNSFGLEYGVQTEVDRQALKITTRVEGTYYGSQTDLIASESGADSNPLDTFLLTLGFGNLLSTSRNSRRQRVSATGGSEFHMGLAFTNTFVRKAPTSAQILECDLSEEIQYSGIRWQLFQLPDDPDVPQNCGVQCGQRTISGTVTATDETTAMAWVKTQRTLAFPSGFGGGAAPATRFITPPKITKSWDFIPLDNGVARGGDANFRVVKVSFSFSEHLPYYPYNE